MTKRVRLSLNDELVRHVAENRNVEAKSMIKRDLINAFDDFGTLLHHAARFNNETIVRHLINNGSAIDALGKDGKTPLEMAMEYEQAKAVEALLQAGANIDIVSANGKSLLQSIFLMKYTEYVLNHTMNPDFKIMQAFVRRVGTEARTTEQFVEKLCVAGCTLHHAVSLKDPVILKGLLLYGHDVNSRNINEGKGSTALHIAVKINDFEMAKVLIENGADVNATDNNRDTPLMFAARQRALAILQVLLQSGADPHQCKTEGYTAWVELFKRDSSQFFDACAIVLLQYGGFPKDTNCSKLLILFAIDLTIRGTRMMDHLVAHMAMLETIEGSRTSIEYCRRMIFERSVVVQVDNYYKLCRQMLEKKVFFSLSLFDLLAGNDRQMRRCARNETFVSKVEKFCAKQLLRPFCPYYYVALRRRISEATRTVQLENQAMLVICNIFQRNEEECYMAARTIISCLSVCDLKHLVKCDEA